MAFAANNLKNLLAAWSYDMVNLQYKGKTKLSVAANDWLIVLYNN